MAGWKDFREIGAWQLARDLKLLAYELLKRPKAAADFKFRDPLLDSARSAPRNIAEGFARFKHKEFAQFARVAKGSEGEVLNHFIGSTLGTTHLVPKHRTHSRNRTHCTHFD